MILFRSLLLTITLLLGAYSVAGATYLGDFPVNATVHWAFSTNNGAGAAVDPLSAWEAADLRCYKDGNDVERASTSGYTITSTFDSKTGLTKVAIDLSDNTTAGFWAAGSEYYCVLAPDTETVDSQTIIAVSANFSIERYTRAPVIFAGTAVVKDSVSVILTIPIVKSSGKPFTGLAFNTATMVAEYCRANAASTCTSITLTGTCSLGTFTSGCLLEKDATAGLYQLHVPNAAFATGTDRGTITVSGVVGAIPTIIPYELVDVGSAALATTLGTPVASVSSDIASVQTTTTSIQGTTYRKNIASQTYAVYMTNSSGNPGLGMTLDIEVSKDGAAFGNIVGSVAEVGQGWYFVTFDQADTNCDLCVFVSKSTGALTRAFYFTTAP